MAGPDSWMPVYWADLWNKTRDLNAVEQCAYYNLLGSMWVEGGSLPNDNARLQRMSRVTEKEWRAVSATVTAYFDLGDDGRLYQKRLSEEYAKALKAYTARSEHMRTVNSNRKQSPPTVTVDGEGHVTHNSQSPIGDTPVAPKGAGTFSEDFLVFWEAFPNQTGKDAAWKAWNEREDRPELAAILAALQRYVRTKPADRKWCNPSKWLREGRWADGAAAQMPESASPETEQQKYERRAAQWAKSPKPPDQRFWHPDWGLPPHKREITLADESSLAIPAFLRRTA